MSWKSLMFALVCLVVSAAFAQPSPRGYVEMTYDAESEVIVLFGGQLGDIRGPDPVSGETWVFHIDDGSWEQRTPVPTPTELVDANAAYDALRDRVVLWGGGNADFVPMNEVWSYDANTDTWHFHETASETAPPGRVGSEMVYDASADKFVIFGGLDLEAGSYLAETWLLDMETEAWTLLESDEAPRGRNFIGLAYDPNTERVYLWGGSGSKDANVWGLDTSAGVWTQYESTEDAPRPQYYVEIESVDELGALLVFGGPQRPSNHLTWLYRPESRTWEQVVGDGPGSRTRFAMANAGPHGTFLFGGQAGSREFEYANDMWRFDTESLTWERIPTD